MIYEILHARGSAGLIGPIVALSAALAAVSPARADATTGLVVSPRHGVVVDHGTSAKYDFGNVDPVTNPMPAATFTVRNSGKTALVITRIQTSCGCTTAILKSADSNGTKTLQPGETVDVEVTVNMGLYIGNVAKQIWIYVDGQSTATDTVEIDGMVKNTVTSVPNVLYFGNVPTGQSQTLNLAFAIDPRLISSDAPLPLTSTNPDISVTALPVDPGDREGSDHYLVRKYSVTLSPKAGIGPVLGWVSFSDTDNPPAAPPGSKLSPQFRSRLLSARAGVGLDGDVSGLVSAAPESLYFGDVKLGHSASKTIAITATSAALFDNAIVSSSSPYLSGSITNDTAGPATVRTLTAQMALPNDVPVNAVVAAITITFSDGERLVIPISAYVDRTGG